MAISLDLSIVPNNNGFTINRMSQLQTDFNAYNCILLCFTAITKIYRLQFNNEKLMVSYAK